MIKVRCPNPACRKVLAVKAELGGKRGRCPLCGQIMSIPAPSAGGGSRTVVGLAPPQSEAPAPVERLEGQEAAAPPPQGPPSGTAAADVQSGVPDRTAAESDAGPPAAPAAAAPGGEASGQPPAQSAPSEAAAQPGPPAAEPQAARAEVGAPGPRGHPTPRTLARISGEVEETTCEIAGGRLTVSGPLGYELNREFRLKCEALMDSPEQSLVIDLAKVPYLSSTHLGVIAPLFSRAKESGKTLTLVADARVARVLRLAGFDKLGTIQVVGGEG